MATFSRKTDPLVNCPYNMAHRILKSRLQLHIVKCQKDHVTVEKSTCPFNAQHLVDKANYKTHITICPDRDIVDRQLLHKEEEEDEHRGALALPPIQSFSAFENYGEIWDLNENPVAGYDPKSMLKGKQLVIDSAHFKPSVKKQMYKTTNDNDDENHPLAIPAPKVEEIFRQPNIEPDVIKDLNVGVIKVPIARPRLAANLPISSAKPRDVKDISIAAEFDNLSIGRGRGGIIPKSQLPYFP